MQRKIQQGWTIDLNDLAASGLLPTPTAHQQNTQYKQGGTSLQAKMNMLLPTPAMSNYKGASSTEALEKRGRLKLKADNLADHFAQTGKTSQLSPLFVMEMMGFPSDWTLLPFQKASGETSPLKPEEMP